MSDSPDPKARASAAAESGQKGESLAASFLRRQGYTIRRVNWRCRQGEIDIIAEEGETLVFVEVKTRRRTAHGRPIEAVTRQKQRRILHAAALYAVSNDFAERPMRFDVVEVFEGADGASCRLQRAAFTPSGYAVL